MMTTGTMTWEMLTGTWGERWAWTLLHSLWQDGLLTIGLWIVLRMLPARLADVRYSCALAAFALAALAPLATWAWLGEPKAESSPSHPVSMPSVNGQVGLAPIPIESASRVEVSRSARSLDRQPVAALSRLAVGGGSSWIHRLAIPLILAVWGLGVTIHLLRTIRDLAATRTLLRGDSVQTAPLQASLARVVELLQIRRRFQVVMSATQAGPFVFGLWKPTLVLPAALIAGLTPDQLEAVLLHELSHLRRYDDVINFIQLLVEAVFFFNPALRWISRELRRERETVCDARAVACLTSPLPLAQALARVAEGLTVAAPAALPAIAFAEETEAGVLLDRVQRILAPDHRPRLRLSWLSLAVTIVLAGILLCGVQQATSWSVELAKKWLTPAERIAAVADVQKDTAVQDLGDLGAFFTISGTIRTEEGSVPPARGTLDAHCEQVSVGHAASYGTSQDASGDTFQISIQPGRCWLIYFAEGYAPVLAGPFPGRGGQRLDGVEIVLKRGVPGGVRVVDRQGRPIASAGVTAMPDWGESFWIGSTTPETTDENGVWKSEHLADVPYRVSVHASGFTPMEATASHRITKEPLVITLDSEKPVTGIVVDANGTTVEGAELRVIAETRGNSSSYLGGSGKLVAESRADGTFEFGDLAIDTEYSLLIDAGDRGHAMLASVRAGTDSIRIVLQKKFILAGEVRGKLSDRPANASVTISCQSAADGINWRGLDTDVDAQGRFHFADMFAGKYQLTIGPHVVNGRLDDSVGDLVIDLAKLKKSDAARDVEISFAENVQIAAQPVAPGGFVTAQMEVVDSRGRSRFGDALPIVDGVVRLRMKTPGTLRLIPEGCLGYWFRDVDMKVPEGDDVFQTQIDVVPAGAIRVKVVAPEKLLKRDGLPSASVQFRHPEGDFIRMFSRNSVSANEVVLSPVPLDVACLASVTQGFRIVHAPIVTLDGAEPVQDLSVALPKAINAVVRVESADGKPLAHVLIEVKYEPVPLPRGAVSRDLSPGANTWGGDRQTDRKGETILAGMPENGTDYTVIAEPKKDWQPARADVRTDGGVTILKLERGLVIEGRVIDKKTGRPVPGLEVRARLADRPLGGPRQYLTEAPTDANGNFRFSNLPNRTVKLIVWGTSFPVEPVVEPGQAELVILEVAVPE
jgi:beta-lactamase regulating signal transducer with metallopeptidase domain